MCQRDSKWLLYTSAVIDADPAALRVQGYEPIAVEGRKLEMFFTRLTALTLPVVPDLSKMGGLMVRSRNSPCLVTFGPK